MIDTNILIRRINRRDPQHRGVRKALNVLEARGDRICVSPQNIIEFWNVATRPANKNGLGLTPPVAGRVVARIEESFHLLTETTDVYHEWRRLVVFFSVSGVKVYDTRLAALSIVLRVGAILTFNVTDFRRFSGFQLLHPNDLL